MLSHIQEELKSLDFDQEKLRTYLEGGQQEYSRKKNLYKAIFSYPQLRKTPAFFSMSREQQMNECYKRCALIFTKILPKFGGYSLNIQELLEIAMTQEGQFQIAIHFGMFLVQIEVMGSDEQVAYWKPKAQSLEVLGCFAQTELGHGSDVQNLETTATFDIASQEFIIHTPTISAAKFWPGELAQISNHAILIARLIVKGKDYGTQTFIVPIRSMDTHKPLPGVELGDIGPKHGFNTKDNGYALFTQFRVPHSALLNRYTRVDKEGRVSHHGDPRIGYYTLLFTRYGVLTEAKGFLAYALTVSLRYSAYRKQFKTNPDGTERKVIDYQNQQYRLVPYLSSYFAYLFTSKRVLSVLRNSEVEVKKGDTSKLGGLHRLLSGLKAFVSWNTFEGLDECRQACGGHGYLKYAGISQIVLDYSCRCTYEGDNGILTQQTGRGLMKQFQKAISGKELDVGCEYLKSFRSLLSLKSSVKQSKDWTPSQILEALQVRATYTITSTAKLIGKLMKQGVSQICIFAEHVQSDLLEASKHHTELYIFQSFYQGLKQAETEIEKAAITHLTVMLKIYGLKCLSTDLSGLLAQKYLYPESGPTVKRALKEAIKKIRPMLIPIIETIAPPDQILLSAIGNKTQDPYETLMAWAKKYNPLNKEELLPGFKEYIMPLMRPKL